MNELFIPGKLTTLLDGGAGSSGKGKVGSFIAKHATNCQFVCNTFAPQAGHWVRLDDGKEYFYQTLNSCACMHNTYDKMYRSAYIHQHISIKNIESNPILSIKHQFFCNCDLYFP